MIQQFHCLYLSEDNENTNSKRYMHPHIQWSIITIVKIRKQPKCPWMMWNKPVCISDSSLVFVFLTSDILPHVAPVMAILLANFTCGCKNSKSKEKKTWLLIYKICVCLLNIHNFHLTWNNQEKSKTQKVK